MLLDLENDTNLCTYVYTHRKKMRWEIKIELTKAADNHEVESKGQKTSCFVKLGHTNTKAALFIYWWVVYWNETLSDALVNWCIMIYDPWQIWCVVTLSSWWQDVWFGCSIQLKICSSSTRMEDVDFHLYKFATDGQNECKDRSSEKW